MFMQKKRIKKRIDEARKLIFSKDQKDEAGIFIINRSIFGLFLDVLQSEIDSKPKKDALQVWQKYLDEGIKDESTNT